MEHPHKEPEKQAAAEQLLTELERGRGSGETEGWLTMDEVRQHLKEKFEQ